ncbi:tissue factor pathway inhibitor-like [Pollicipes pollicipes]|uniref:tissue factor pathway inhibitor-like n=1 Tax=Pollicipes pollicipes TaxID=41117 RepID=UPI001884C2AA|nr:tissue factor pathway inhibitor-like [Pollicipes pollicipes]
MTAPFVTTVTKPAPASSRLRRALMAVALLLPLLLAVGVLAWLVTPQTGDGKAEWLERLFSGGQTQHDESVCSLAMEAGPCRGALQRFYYSPEAGGCTAFLYGGCDGNANNFETLEMCRAQCGGGQSDTKRAHEQKGADICTLPAEVGDCRAALPRYFFDPKSSQCKEFTYGGCGGNRNNFQTLEDCEQKCRSDQRGAADCTSAPDGGLCMAYMERYAYHPDTDSCQKFVYGGCGGNGNRYNTREECETRCAQTTTGDEEGVASELQEGRDYDTRACGVSECPADCGLVGRQADCVLCRCGHQPHLEPGQLAVAAGQPCPAGYSRLHEDFSAVVCAPDPAVPTPSP